jgi:hypothetical protein
MALHGPYGEISGFESQDDAIDVAFPIVGLAQAINRLLDPVSGDPESAETRFAARTSAEALQGVNFGMVGDRALK